MRDFFNMQKNIIDKTKEMNSNILWQAKKKTPSLVWTEWKWYVRWTMDRWWTASMTEQPNFFDRTINRFKNNWLKPVQDMARPQDEVRAERVNKFKEYWNLAWWLEQKWQALKWPMLHYMFNTAKGLAWPDLRSVWKIATDPSWYIDDYLPDSMKWWWLWKWLWMTILGLPSEPHLE